MLQLAVTKRFIQHWQCLQWHFPLHNNAIWLTNCFNGLQWKILVYDNKWFILNFIVFYMYLNPKYPKHVDDPTWKCIHSLFLGKQQKIRTLWYPKCFKLIVAYLFNQPTDIFIDFSITPSQRQTYTWSQNSLIDNSLLVSMHSSYRVFDSLDEHTNCICPDTPLVDKRW